MSLPGTQDSRTFCSFLHCCGRNPKCSVEKALEDAQILSAKTGPSFEKRDHSVSSSWLNCCFLKRNEYFEEGWGIHSPCRGAGLLGGPYSDQDVLRICVWEVMGISLAEVGCSLGVGWAGARLAPRMSLWLLTLCPFSIQRTLGQMSRCTQCFSAHLRLKERQGLQQQRSHVCEQPFWSFL